MLNKRLLKNNITLFSRYRAIDENDSVFKNDYSEVVVPTFIHNCLYISKKNYNTNNGINYSLGNVEITLSLEQDTTQVYRIINNRKVFINYIDEAAYKTLSLEEQYNKYFTLSSGLMFVNGIYEHSKELDISSIKIKNLEASGLDRHTINSITKPSKNIITLSAKIG